MATSSLDAGDDLKSKKKGKKDKGGSPPVKETTPFLGVQKRDSDNLTTVIGSPTRATKWDEVLSAYNALMADELTLKQKRESFMETAGNLFNGAETPPAGSEERVPEPRASRHGDGQVVPGIFSTKLAQGSPQQGGKVTTNIPFVLDSGLCVELTANFSVKKGKTEPSAASGRRSRAMVPTKTLDVMIQERMDKQQQAERSCIYRLRKHLKEIESRTSYNIFLGTLILVSSGMSIYQTMPECTDEESQFLMNFDLAFNIYFTLAIVFRILTDPRVGTFKSLYLWVDIVAVIPFYIYYIGGYKYDANWFIELLFVLTPPLRLFMTTRHSDSWRLLLRSLGNAFQPICVPAFFLALIMTVASCLLYWVEKYAQTEDRPSVFTSVPYTMWYAIVTTSTVGYGDIYPQSTWGRLGGTMLIGVGVCCFAMPLAIVGNAFVAVWDNRDLILISEKVQGVLCDSGTGPEEVTIIFDTLDQDGSGYLSKSEFITLFEKLDLGLPQKDVKKFFMSIDKDNTGQISFDEFQNCLFPDTVED